VADRDTGQEGGASVGDMSAPGLAWSLGGAALVLLSLVSLACDPPHALGTKITSPPLLGTDGVLHGIAPGDSARFTVIVFFASHAPCQSAHDVRLRELYATYRPRGVDFLVVDSEASATLERDRDEAASRGYPFPIVLDRGSALAHRLDAAYATEAFVIDRFGDVRYHGGIDSDERVLHDDAKGFLRDALDDLLAGAPLRQEETKAPRCALRTW